MKNSIKILIIGTVWPEPTSSAAGSRMLQLISAFHEASNEITFVSASPKNEFTKQLKALGCITEQIELNDSSFDDFIKELSPDLVLFDRFMIEEQFGWRVMEQCPDALRILDTEDLHGLRKSRQLAVKNGTNNWRQFLLNDTTKRELASILRCDLSLIISEAEIEILKSLGISESLLHYVPFMLDVEVRKSLKSFKERQHFVTIGNFKHAPNEDAVHYLKDTIWPLIRQQLPEAELHIYGAYAQQKHLDLTNNSEGFIVKGTAEDALITVENYKVLLAPLRYGAGLKGKLFDAMQTGTPIAMSTIASEGIYNETISELEIEVASFVKTAIDLYQGENIWNEQQEKGFQILKERFNKNEHAASLTTLVKSINNNLETHRAQNPISQVIQHQSLLAHRYLSKWIEEKTKQ